MKEILLNDAFFSRLETLDLNLRSNLIGYFGGKHFVKTYGQTVEFDRVLLVDADGAVKVGAPLVEGAKVVCEVEKSLVKGDKVIVFKKKRRNDYRRKNGHRQYFTKVVIKDIVA